MRGEGRTKPKMQPKNNSSCRGKWTVEELPQETLISFTQIVNQNLAELLMEGNEWETVVLAYCGGTEYSSEEEHSSFLSGQNEFLTPFKLGGETAIFLD